MKRLYLQTISPIILLLILFICGAAYALQGSTGANGSNAQALHSLGIRGKGVNIGFVSIQNVFVEHNAFRDSNGIVHVENVNTDVVNGWHDTVLAGIMISQGQSPDHLNDIGVCPDANVYCYRLGSSTGTSLQKIVKELIETRECKVIVTGFEYDANANGQTQETETYDYYADICDVTFSVAAGNTGTKITVLGDAYNGITTGGLAETQTDNYQITGDATNDGPTSDGRRKPDVMAPSTNQVVPGYNNGDPNWWNTGYSDGATSWAIPHTAGVAALLLQYANQSAEADDGHNTVIKAVIVNSAFGNILKRDGTPTYPANPANVWNEQRGYGRIDALRAYQTLSAGKISKSTIVNSPKGWAYDTMSSATHTYIIRGKKNKRLVLTVTWNRKINYNKSTGIYSVDTPLFNIDLTVKDPCGNTIYSETNTKDNLEKIDMLLPADGNYTVSLHNTTTKSRTYSLAFELLEPITGDFNIDYIVDEKDLNRIAIEWLTAGAETDIVHDSNNIVNYLDFAAFANNWLKIDKRYFNP
ncbi:MAG: S8 family serine peptidase [Sedimentisphaerales bacterium]